MSHITGKTPEQMRDYLRRFVSQPHHAKWIADVGSVFLAKKGLKVSDYLENITSPGVPLDELALLIFARMYHDQIAIICQDRVVYSSLKATMHDCRFILVYGGGVTFYLAANRGPEDSMTPLPLNLSLKTQLDTDAWNPLSGTRNRKSNQLGRNNTKKPKSISSRSKKRSVSSGSKKTSSSRSVPSRSKPRRSSRIVSMPLQVHYVRATKNSRKPTFNLSLDTVLSKNRSRKRLAAPTNLKEEDPIAPDLSDPSDLELNTPKSDKESDYINDEEDAKNVEKIETDSGNITIKKHGLIKRERKTKVIICPACTETLHSQSKMNHHMKKEHPNLKFQCSMCDEMYKTYNACYRHCNRHFQLRYECNKCDHKSQFPHQMQAHLRTHTKKQLIPCTWRGCTRKFTSKKSMWQHMQSHSPETWECKECDPEKSFDTYSNYRQHHRGLHGIGWRALCGKLFQWPHRRSKHQKGGECVKCEEIKEERKNLPQNPRPFRGRVKLTYTSDENKSEPSEP